MKYYACLNFSKSTIKLYGTFFSIEYIMHALKKLVVKSVLKITICYVLYILLDYNACTNNLMQTIQQLSNTLFK